MLQTSDTRKEIEAGLIALAKADPSFRQALLSDPQVAIERRFGAPLPNRARLIVVEETATTNYLVLPEAADGALLLAGRIGKRRAWTACRSFWTYSAP